MDARKTISKVIPEGELNCIWAEAGLVSYKLCDRNYECDECPFDQVMRQKSSPASASAGTPARSSTRNDRVNPAGRETLSDMIRTLFETPFDDIPPSDRLYTRGHVWVKEISPNVCRIGLDHYTAILLEGITGMVLPQSGAQVTRGNPCAWMLSEGETVAVNSPLDGKIRRVNPDLRESIASVRGDPYVSGWISEISCGEGTLYDCIGAEAAEAFAREQFRKLELSLAAEFDLARPSSIGTTLMDGGTHLRGLKDLLGTEKYVSFLQKLLVPRI